MEQEDIPPLQLEDSRAGSDHGEGDSTQAVDPGDAAGSQGDHPNLKLASSHESASAASPGSSMGGSTTGGFDTMLGKLVIRAGLATEEEVEACSASARAASESDADQSLAEVLVSRDYVTRHQLGRLRDEFEAKKSSQDIPGYKIKRKLGAGAMATVFLAQQVSLDRPVAIKILPKKFSDNEKFIERFYKEGRAAAKLNHPNIVGAYDVGRAGEHHYFVMEFVDGLTVYDLIERKKRIPEEDAVEIVIQVARALEHAHERGFIHRDIKPKNIMFTKKGVVKLADLGLARAVTDREAAKAEAGRAYGTPYYISPEQIRGELEIGPQADIYGLGATFYHMMTGQVPFRGKNPSAVMHKHLKSPLEPPDHVNPAISAGCAQVIEMMMAKDRDDRYRNVQDLIEDLELVKAGEPPHFAHRSFDHASITEAITDVATTTSAEPVRAPDPTDGGGDSPVFLITAIVAGVSVIVNLILLAVLLSS
jgi:serine/threonine protein kinase